MSTSTPIGTKLTSQRLEEYVRATGGDNASVYLSFWKSLYASDARASRFRRTSPSDLSRIATFENAYAKAESLFRDGEVSAESSTGQGLPAPGSTSLTNESHPPPYWPISRIPSWSGLVEPDASRADKESAFFEGFALAGLQSRKYQTRFPAATLWHIWGIDGLLIQSGKIPIKDNGSSAGLDGLAYGFLKLQETLDGWEEHEREMQARPAGRE